MPKTLIAIINARHRKEERAAVRSTWLNQVPKDKCDAFFFMGNGEPREFSKDEVALDCSDKYEHLPEKVREIARWSLRNSYTNVLKCDDDVVLRPKSLLQSDYYLHEFVGRSGRDPQPYMVPYGFCYWMGDKSLRIVTEEPLPGDGSNDDEKWVATSLYKNGISLHNDLRYTLHTTPYPEDNRRALRFKRTVQNNLETFAWCIHIPGKDNRLEEFYRVYERHKEI